MESLGTIIMLLGALIGAVGGIWIIVLAFQESIGWGVGSLLCGIVGLIFAIQHFSETKIPLLLVLIGIVLRVIAIPMVAHNS